MAQSNVTQTSPALDAKLLFQLLPPVAFSPSRECLKIHLVIRQKALFFSMGTDFFFYFISTKAVTEIVNTEKFRIDSNFNLQAASASNRRREKKLP
jgi:hypothetical protein